MPDFERPVTPPEAANATELANTQARVQSVLGDLRPAEVLALHRRVYAWEYNKISADIALQEYAGKLEGSISLTSCVDKAIVALRDVNMPRLEAIVTAFADSSDPQDRYQLAAGMISDVTKASPSVGIPLWDRLLRDEDELVRETAKDNLDYISLDTDELSHAEFVAETGFSREQYDQLTTAHAEAERGERIFNLGEAVVRKLVDQQPPDQP